MKRARLRFAPLVVLVLCAASPRLAYAESGNSGKGSAGSSSGSSGSSGSGSGSSGSSKSTTSSLTPEDDTSSTNVSTSTPTVTPTATPTTAVGSLPTSTRPPIPTGISTTSPTTNQPPPSATAASPTFAPTTVGAAGGPVDRQFERATSCGKFTLRVEVRSDGSIVRVRSTIDRTKAQWSAVVLQERRVVWRGSVTKGRIDRRFTDLPGPELVAVRLTNSTGAVCAAEIRLPG